MKTKLMLLLVTSSMFVTAGLPLATAEEPCSRAGSTEAIAHPTRKDAYIYLDLTHPDKIGEWVETNGALGLQTVTCFAFSTVLRYRADVKTDILG